MKTACAVCGGSGEVASFKGVSRFLLSYEACPVCGGLGYVMEEALPQADQEAAGHATPPRPRPRPPSPGKKSGRGKR